MFSLNTLSCLTKPIYILGKFIDLFIQLLFAKAEIIIYTDT